MVIGEPKGIQIWLGAACRSGTWGQLHFGIRVARVGTLLLQMIPRLWVYSPHIKGVVPLAVTASTPRVTKSPKTRFRCSTCFFCFFGWGSSGSNLQSELVQRPAGLRTAKRPSSPGLRGQRATGGRGHPMVRPQEERNSEGAEKR